MRRNEYGEHPWTGRFMVALWGGTLLFIVAMVIIAIKAEASPLPPCVAETAPVNGNPCPWVDPGSGLRYYYCPLTGTWSHAWQDCS